jgi:hypothetical protein
VLHRHRDLALAAERRLAGQHLVEDDPERVDVGLAGHLVAERLLRGDVVGRAEHAPGRGQPLRLERPRDPEVGHLRPALGVDQDVLRLDVAVDEHLGVRGRQRSSDLDRVGHGLADGQPAEPADSLLERLALDVLEHDVRRAVVLAGVDHGDDVRVREPGHRARLAAEALELVRVVGDVPVHQLDRDPALERRVVGAVDRRHPPGADLLLEPVAVVEECADHVRLFCALGWP